MAEDGFVEVRGANRGNNVILHLFAVALMVTGPIVYAANDGGTVAIVLTVVLLPLGIAVWRGIARAKRRLLRLDEVGLPATAVVLSVEPISEDPTVRVRLLIKGPDGWPVAAWNQSSQSANSASSSGSSAGVKSRSVRRTCPAYVSLATGARKARSA